MTTNPGRPRVHGDQHDENERGSLSTEMVVVIPLIVLLLLFVIGAARLVHARDLVNQAADQAANAAAIGAGGGTQARAQDGARAVLDGDHECGNPHVAVRQNQAAHSVTTVVSCSVPLRDLLMAGFPGRETISSSQTAPRDLYAPGN